jgi:putative flippase GtrA
MVDDRPSATAGEFGRFAVVGVVSNVVVFVLYLFMTQTGLGHKIAATLAYALGVLQTFILNRSWSFRDQGAVAPALGRYVAAYGLGYVANIAGLVILVDLAGYAHQWVQGGLVIIVAVLLFGLQKFWVFRESVTER